jgi:hypothetical protein
MRPSTDDDRVLVLPPGRAYAEVIDPHLYCFGAREHAALEGGGQMTARLGWHGGAQTRPFVVAPFEGIEPRVAATKELTTTSSIAVPASTPNPSSNPAPTSAPLASLEPRLSVHMPPLVDAANAGDLALTITVANASDRPAWLRLRPDTVTFTVTGPTGAATRCARAQTLGTPTRELFDNVPAHGSAHVAVLVSAVCPAGTFSAPGLYRILPGIDTRRASGDRIGLPTFEGELSSTETSLLRVRTSHQSQLQPRPALE